MSTARFITFEGVDGAGKSTHLNWFADQLRARGHEVLMTREPGGTPLGEQLREILLNQPMTIDTEVMLMFAARMEHLETVIRPALARGVWVISDRFTDATFAYQGGGRGVPPARLEQLEAWVQQSFQPDMTLLFDVPIEVARQRLSANRAPDRFEQEQSDFFERVRHAYHKRASAQAGRFEVIDASGTPDDVRALLVKALAKL
jgi:dTMP kinase